MVVNGDPSLSKIASNFGLNYKTLYNWVKGSMPESSSTQAGKSKSKELESELRALRRDLRARQECDILKRPQRTLLAKSREVCIPGHQCPIDLMSEACSMSASWLIINGCTTP